jgi:hypothetical protein
MAKAMNKKEFDTYFKSWVKKYGEKYPLNVYYRIRNARRLNADDVETIILWKYGKLKQKLEHRKIPKNHKKIIARAIKILSAINEYKKGKKDKSSTERFREIIYNNVTKRIVTNALLLHICNYREYALYDIFVYKAFCRYYGKTPKKRADKNDYEEYNKWFKERCKEHPKEDLKKVDCVYMMAEQKQTKNKKCI